MRTASEQDKRLEGFKAWARDDERIPLLAQVSTEWFIARDDARVLVAEYDAANARITELEEAIDDHLLDEDCQARTRLRDVISGSSKRP